MRTRKEIENLQEYEVCRYDGLGKPPTCHQEVPTQIELLLDIRDVLAKNNMTKEEKYQENLKIIKKLAS